MEGKLHRKAALAAALILAYQAPLASAQGLEEVIVTAQKRAQSAQDVPVALTAVSAETIEAMGIQEFSDVTRISPSLTLSSGNNKQQTSISIRGIGTSVFSIGVEPSVAVIIDNVSQVQPGQALSNLVDIERIEVLRGPQSTLFGKNASAGLVSVTTRNPSEELGVVLNWWLRTMINCAPWAHYPVRLATALVIASWVFTMTAMGI